ncbi:DUF3300 domain-containing protein [Frateuria aurantia]
MTHSLTRQLLASLPLLAVAVIEGCSSSDRSSTPAVAATAPLAAMPAGSVAPAPASSAAAPDAQQLYQLVAPIALFPDPLLAQVLAASEHPDQIAAEAQMLQQNPGLTASALQAALTPQSWDPAVKGLASFPSVLNQMARSPGWTAALGQAYARDPTDLMNAVQTLRQRAIAKGHLKSTAQQTVTTRTVTTTETTTGEMVPAPQDYVEIAPAADDMVYVPSYDPDAVYGEDYGMYPGYYMPAEVYDPGWSDGLVLFGSGIAIGALLSQPWGWSHWGMHWGGPPPPGPGDGWRAPSVYYDHRHYQSQPSFGRGDFRAAAGAPRAPGFGGGANPPGGHWQSPHFDQQLNAHHWSSNPAGPGTGGRDTAGEPQFHAHAGPDGNRVDAGGVHSHPVSYIHNDFAEDHAPAERGTGAPREAAGNVQRAAQEGRAEAAGRGFNPDAGFHPAARQAGQTFRSSAPIPRAQPAHAEAPRGQSHPAPAPPHREGHHR